MFNYHYKQYIFRQSNGELMNFFCDQKQNLCYNTLTRRNIWSNPVILHKNAYQYFHADMDLDDVFHLLFQDSEGNIRYSRMDGQSLKTVTVLGSKTPNPYNKQLFLAPFKKSVFFFYVVQHENSFMLAYQVLSNSKISSPKVLDYVSGSSLPCSIVYDRDENIYTFYQSYDGKYLQLGYKKYTSSQKHWSEFMPITKYAGTCEYPHAFIDDNGIIHLCYQRRAPKAFEMVYLQKAPDKNLWSPETVIHTSIHSFDNASILQENKNMQIYWVRDDIIYYSTGTLQGTGWIKPARLNFFAGHQLQCLGFKSNSPADGKTDESGERDQVSGQETASTEKSQSTVLRVNSPARSGDFGTDFRTEDSSPYGFSGQMRAENHPLYGFVHPPMILPGNLSNGVKMAFIGNGSSGATGTATPFISESSDTGSFSSNELKRLVTDTLRLIQGNIEELKTGMAAVKSEMARLNYTHEEMSRQLDKYEIRLSLFENRLAQSKRIVKSDKAVSENRDIDITEISIKAETGSEIASRDTGVANRGSGTAGRDSSTANRDSGILSRNSGVTVNQDSDTASHDQGTSAQTEKKSQKKALPSLDQDKLKEWQEWEEPEEWKGM